MEMIKNLALATDTVSTTPDWMVVVMGVGVVFVGLVLIILICKIMGLFFARTAKSNSNSKPEVTVSPAATNATIENRQEIIAAVTAACAEEMGTDISALRVISFKKI